MFLLNKSTEHVTKHTESKDIWNLQARIPTLVLSQKFFLISQKCQLPWNIWYCTSFISNRRWTDIGEDCFKFPRGTSPLRNIALLMFKSSTSIIACFHHLFLLVVTHHSPPSHFCHQAQKILIIHLCCGSSYSGGSAVPWINSTRKTETTEGKNDAMMGIICDTPRSCCKYLRKCHCRYVQRLFYEGDKCIFFWN